MESSNEGKYVDEIEVFKSEADGQWYYRGKSNNGNTLFISEGYTRKGDAFEAANDLADQGDTVVEIIDD